MRRTRADEIDRLLEETAAAEAKRRAAALRSLCPCHIKRNERRVWDQVLVMAADESAAVRRTVLHVLADGSPRERESEVVAAMERLCQDGDTGIRRQARKVMARYRRGSTINVL